MNDNDALPAPDATSGAAQPSLPTGWDVLIAGGIPLAIFLGLVVAERGLSTSTGDAKAAKDLSLAYIVIAIVAQNLFMLLCAFIATRRQRRSVRQVLGLVALKWWYPLAAVALGLLVAPILSYAVELLQMVLGYERHTPGVEIIAPDGFSWRAFAIMVAAAGVLAPDRKSVV